MLEACANNHVCALAFLPDEVRFRHPHILEVEERRAMAAVELHLHPPGNLSQTEEERRAVWLSQRLQTEETRQAKSGELLNT